MNFTGIYTQEELEGLFSGIANLKLKFALEEIALTTKFVCVGIGKNAQFRKVSFLKEPLNYIFDKTGERAYNEAIKDITNNLNGEEFEKNIALSLLTMYQENGAYIPEAVLKEMNKFQK
jgi:hypothetical protein